MYMLRPQIAARKTSKKQFNSLSNQTKGARKLRNTTAKHIRYLKWTLEHAWSLPSQKSNQIERETIWNALKKLFDYENAFEGMDLSMLISKVVEMGLRGNMLILLQSDFRCNLQQV